jgi:predicted enzyme involved in methoxymalonyl-ACP biosynthesis
MKELEYPFDNGFIMKKKRSLKRQLLGDGAVRLKKRVAVLGGSTTDDIVSVLELFLLDMGFECEFYRSEYGQFWQDAVFSNEELDRFKPDIVYIHTSLRNCIDHALILADRNKRTAESANIGGRHDAALLNLII